MARGIWDTIGEEASRESVLWAEALRPDHERELVAVFSPLGESRYALGLETIYEGFLLHYGRPRLFAPDSGETALLLGDYLYAHGLVRVAECQNVVAVADLAELISLCAQLRADSAGGEGAAWAATAALLGRGPLRASREPVALARLVRETVVADALDHALALHAERVG